MSQPTQAPPSEAPFAASVLAIGGPGLLNLAQIHRRRQQTLAQRARDALARLWNGVDPRNAERSWATVAPRAARLLRIALTEAARGADEYVVAALRHQGVRSAVPNVLAPAFALSTADGRDITGLLGYPAFEVSAFVDQGMPHAQALAIGGRHLDRIASTEVADAARAATGVAVASDRKTIGYVRMLTPPSCSRCVILAGRFYKWNVGFQRHPQCDCVHIPVSEDAAGDVRTDPKAYFDSLSEDEQDKVFTKAGAQAIRDGADLSRTVNARRGMYEAGGRKFTTEATTRRGTGRRARLMPEQIYREANGDRDEAIRLLKLHGYIR